MGDVSSPTQQHPMMVQRSVSQHSYPPTPGSTGMTSQPSMDYAQLQPVPSHDIYMDSHQHHHVYNDPPPPQQQPPPQSAPQQHQPPPGPTRRYQQTQKQTLQQQQQVNQQMQLVERHMGVTQSRQSAYQKAQKRSQQQSSTAYIRHEALNATSSHQPQHQQQHYVQAQPQQMQNQHHMDYMHAPPQTPHPQQQHQQQFVQMEHPPPQQNYRQQPMRQAPQQHQPVQQHQMQPPNQEIMPPRAKQARMTTSYVDQQNQMPPPQQNQIFHQQQPMPQQHHIPQQQQQIVHHQQPQGHIQQTQHVYVDPQPPPQRQIHSQPPPQHVPQHSVAQQHVQHPQHGHPQMAPPPPPQQQQPLPPQPQQMHPPPQHPTSIAPGPVPHPHPAPPAAAVHHAPPPQAQAPPAQVFHDLENDSQVVSAKEHYRQLKRKFRDIVYENECYQEELRNLQRKLLKLSRDKNFLLDRLIIYEKDNLSESSDDSDASVATVEEKPKAVPKKKARPPPKRKQAANANAGPSTSGAGATTGGSSRRTSRPAPPKVKVEVTPLPPLTKTSSQPSTSGLGNSRQQQHHQHQMHHFQHIDDSSSDRLKPLSPEDFVLLAFSTICSCSVIVVNRAFLSIMTSKSVKIPEMFLRASRAAKKVESVSASSITFCTTNASNTAGPSSAVELPEIPEEEQSACTPALPYDFLKASIEDEKWRELLDVEFKKKYMTEIVEFLDRQKKKGVQVFPPRDEIFSAFNLTPFDKIRVVLLGQDPYHDDGQAHGLCFSVKHGIRPPPSLKNMYKELVTDIGKFNVPTHGCLIPWAEQGIFMLNASLTVEAHKANSHSKIGWQRFTDEVIKIINRHADGVVFLLWGGFAHKKEALIDRKKHAVIKAAHPSPLSFRHFQGCKCFSKTNEALGRLGKQPIDWNSL
ncbi:hypothetical protein QR680_014141 [Steinernema hermaphroditum]|uniref:Uracil-DNA glycosylase n=1 Tax=Steinernema hermaphroditum TaxID=289476 RepID=A0AA39I978_9BILA|nr:hypothetical protein QR680_014141 [Steinernema hermaphroditum]